jgi:oligopeptidase B
LWILTNDDHVNFRLAEADPANPGGVADGDRRLGPRLSARRHRLSRPSRDQQRVDGLDQLILRTYDGEETRIPFEGASYSAGFGGNPEFAPDAYRLGYSSMVTPRRSTIITRPSGGSRRSRSRKSRRATTRRNMRPSG